jgi:cytidylate kinase
MRRPGKGERDGRLITVVVDGEDVSWAIRDEQVSRQVPVVAKLGEIRKVLVKKQQEIASGTEVVMEHGITSG